DNKSLDRSGGSVFRNIKVRRSGSVTRRPVNSIVGFCNYRYSEMTLRLVLAATIFAIGTAASTSAQELRDRQLKPAADFTTIQMPVEIVSVKLKGSDVAPGQKIKGDDDWLKGVSFTLKNISDKPIAYVEVGLR